LIDALDCADEFAESYRLGDIRIDAGTIGLINILFLSRTGEHYNDQFRTGAIFANPSKRLNAIHLWHSQIKQQDRWERIFPRRDTKTPSLYLPAFSCRGPQGRADQPEFSRRLPATPRPDARFRLARAFNRADARDSYSLRIVFGLE